MHDHCGGVLDGAFVCPAVKSGSARFVQFTGSQTYGEAGELREERDLASINKNVR